MNYTVEFCQEHVLTVGPEQALLAIANDSVPASESASRRPRVIYLNAGVIHRVGPHRLHVVLSRRLAARGFPGLRVDLSGIGDSSGVPGNLTFRESAVADTRMAMDHLAETSGDHRFVLFGLCAGADNGLATAEVDERVVGLVLLDPHGYPTRQARMRESLQKIRSHGLNLTTAMWLAKVGLRKVRELPARFLQEKQEQEKGPAPGRQAPPREEYGALLAKLANRGVRILSVFSGSVGVYNNHVDQLFESFPELRGKIDVAYFPRSNHVFTEQAMREELMVTVESWLERVFS